MILLFLIVAVSFGNSCSNKIAGKKVDGFPVDLKIHLIDDKDSVHIFAYIESEETEHGKDIFLNSIINIKGQLIGSNSGKTYEILFARQQARVWETSESKYVAFALAGKILGIDNIDINEYSINIQFETNNKFYTIEKPCSQILREQQYLLGKGLIVVPYFEMEEDKSGVFGLFAYRIQPIEEYLPSSEGLRIEIFSQKGKTVFSSNKGQAFLTVIKEVAPHQIGSVYEYSYPWFGKSDGGYELSTGNYSARVYIPAVPNPYGKIINFYWENDE